MEEEKACFEEVQQLVKRRTQELQRLLSQPFHSLSTLKETEVPETMGVYLFYDEKSELPIYIGRVEQVKAKSSLKPSGLRFRIMHKGWQ